MTSMGITGQRYVAALPAEATNDTGTLESLASQFPAGRVKIERTGTKLSLTIPGGIAALIGTVILGASLLSRPGAASSLPSRLNLAPLFIGGSLVGAGAVAVLGASLIKPKDTYALATNIPTRSKAHEVASTFQRLTKIAEDVNGRFAVIDEGPPSTGNSGGNYNGGGYHYGGPGYYYPDGHYYPGHYPDPYYPGSGGYYDSRPDSYPYVPYGGTTGPGDSGTYYPPNNGGGTYYPPSDGGSYYPPSSGGNTGPGDSGGYNPPSSYDPPSYNPPSYDPPSYDPPSYDPPSYDPPSYDPPSYDPPSYDPPSYDPPSYDSSPNGDPGYDDF